jgi:NAD(P)-dependent dehydrogenase (short-subunit alcohol dehydrogenase family)
MGEQAAIVAGASRGIGLAIAKALAGAGHPVALVARSADRLAAAAAELNGAAGREIAVPIAADLAGGREAARACEQATARLGPVGILVNAVGAAASAPFAATDLSAFRESFEINLAPAAAMTAALWEGMLERGAGHVVNIASTAGLEGYAYTSAYTSAKHALVGLTRALAREGTPKGVRVNAVCPGFVKTDLLEGSVDRIIGTTGRSRAQALEALAKMNRGGRLLDPAEVAAVVLWLLRDAPGDLNGEAIVVDGLPGPWAPDGEPPLPVNPEALGEARGYSNGMVMRTGRTLFVAGQVAWDGEHRIVGGGDFAAQFDQALGNVLEVVVAAGGAATDIGRLRFYVSDCRLYLDALREVGRSYRARMGTHYPAMALVEVSRLLEAGALVEIEAEAIL